MELSERKTLPSEEASRSDSTDSKGPIDTVVKVGTFVAKNLYWITPLLEAGYKGVRWVVLKIKEAIKRKKEDKVENR